VVAAAAAEDAEQAQAVLAAQPNLGEPL